ncbi:MAG TPA: hypothetical protein VFU70_00465 [Pseudolabrys sp.]|jgi:hypothetical protein|nr:hypothetical protein [Pseudolabrys sp.]
MLYIGLLAGVLMIVVAIVLAWYVRPIDGKVNPRLAPLVEPYAATIILGLAVFGLVTFLFELASLFS